MRKKRIPDKLNGSQTEGKITPNVCGFLTPFFLKRTGKKNISCQTGLCRKYYGETRYLTSIFFILLLFFFFFQREKLARLIPTTVHIAVNTK